MLRGRYPDAIPQDGDDGIEPCAQVLELVVRLRIRKLNLGLLPLPRSWLEARL